MTNKNPPPSKFDKPSLRMPNAFTDRRKKSRKKDLLYQFMVGLNIIAWMLLVSSLVVLHYARPEFITGVQSYWGITGREVWSQTHVDGLLTLLQICLLTTIISIVLRSRRNRRKADKFGVNVLILLIISLASLATIYMSV